mmetsp:Transcript_85871/g.148697  ORF Transcript_85871/g.148697 Transcript_85871/m.148697 type:complete len:245 (+) Transcript_85871:75-809(+)
MKMNKKMKTALKAAPFIIGPFLLRKLLLHNFAERALMFCEFVKAQGTVGIVIYMVVFSIWVVLCMPSTILEILPGFLFGTWTGFLVCMVGKNVGSFAAMILGRTILEDVMQQKAKEWPLLDGIKIAIQKQGFMMILLVRTVMMPIAIKNYGLAAIGVPAWMNISAAVLSGIPFCFMWVYVGSTTKSLVEIVEGKKSVRDLDLPPWAMISAGVSGFVVLGLGGMYVKRVFDTAMEEVKKKTEKAT